MEIRWPSWEHLEKLWARSKYGARVLSVLGVLKLIFDLLVWLLDWKSRVEEAVETSGQVAPVLSVVLRAVMSPWFGVALIVLVVLYLAFVPAEAHPAEAYPTLGVQVANVFAWVTVGACALLLWGALVAGYIAVHLPKLAVEGVDDPLALVPQSGQSVPPKVSKFARIKVTNIGEKSIAHVKAVVTKVDDRESSLQLPLSSLDALFQLVPPLPIQGEEFLSPGETQYFDALVECNGVVCPSGELAVPHIEGGRRFFATESDGKRVALRPTHLTVRVSGDGASAMTKTFVILLGPDGRLLLQG